MIPFSNSKAQITALWVFAASQPFDAAGAFIFLDSLSDDFSDHEGDLRHSAMHACFAAALDQAQEQEARIALMNIIGELER